MKCWRKVRDSNPSRLAPKRFSRPPHSTALPTFQSFYKYSKRKRFCQKLFAPFCKYRTFVLFYNYIESYFCFRYNILMRFSKSYCFVNISKACRFIVFLPKRQRKQKYYFGNHARSALSSYTIIEISVRSVQIARVITVASIASVCVASI